MPYGLKGLIHYSENDKELADLSTIDDTNNRCSVFSFLDSTYPIKPILFPLSCLTELMFIEGKLIAPIEIIKSFNLGHVDWLTKEREHWIKEYGLEGYIGRIPHKIIEFFNENHIDYENLIERNLAISVFDLPENPYK